MEALTATNLRRSFHRIVVSFAPTSIRWYTVERATKKLRIFASPFYELKSASPQEESTYIMYAPIVRDCITIVCRRLQLAEHTSVWAKQDTGEPGRTSEASVLRMHYEIFTSLAISTRLLYRTLMVAAPIKSWAYVAFRLALLRTCRGAPLD
jgi:hypothetical protein